MTDAATPTAFETAHTFHFFAINPFLFFIFYLEKCQLQLSLHNLRMLYSTSVLLLLKIGEFDITYQKIKGMTLTISLKTLMGCQLTQFFCF